MAGGGIPIGQWSGSDATRELTEAIIKMNVASEKQTKKIIVLTWALTIMTGLMLVGLVVQVWLALR